jgi:peroxiredoxin
MRALVRLAAAGLAACAVGCGTPGKVDVVPLQQVSRPAEANQQPPRDMMEMVDRGSPVATVEGTKVIAADSAELCPKVTVTTLEGRRTEVQLSRAGYVTLVVFWSMEWADARAVARHTSDLEKQYREWRVRAVGVLLKTPRADTALEFMKAAGIQYPLYVDDLTALKEMADAADADTPEAMPAVFIVDRRQRVRFYRPGFAFMMGGTNRQDPLALTVLESAPQGKRIEDYLKAILQEG